jgi:hypothetical protein
MKKNLLLFFTCLLAFIKTNAQERYLDRVFPSVKVQSGMTYGVNATVLLIPFYHEAIPQPLLFDLYTPEGDTKTDRPLIIYFHSGNFLPFPQNQSVSGTRTDSTVVEMCTRLAQMGYVVASADYRLGWDPTNTVKAVRTSGIINAAYRGVQDANTCIRYFKKSFAENGNIYGIDTSKITLWGQGTGGYVAMNCSALDTYNKIPSASNGKFLLTIPPSTIVPMILPNTNGDIEGKTFGVVPPGSGLGALWGVPDGDTLCYPNHTTYSSNFQLGVNMGGAIGDSAWIDPGQKPLISFQTTNDPFAPYKNGIVVVPVTPPLEVVEVQGSYIVQQLSNAYGNNDAYSTTSKNFTDVYSKAANNLNDGYEGLYPILRANPYDSSPWDFWASSNPNDTTGRKTNPDMSPEKARLFMDTIIAYAAPRACLALGLNCDLGRYTGTKNLDPASVGLEITPNPAQDNIHISTYSDFPILSAHIMDINGRCYKSVEKVNSNQLTINRTNLNSGMYIVRLRFEKGEAYSKVIFK